MRAVLEPHCEFTLLWEAGGEREGWRRGQDHSISQDS